MQKLRKVKNVACAFLSAVFFVICCLLVQSVNACKLWEIPGQRTFYLSSASSWAIQTQTPPFFQLSRIKGESVCLDGEKHALTADEILKLYAAEVVLVEEAANVVCYYAYSEDFTNCVWIDGRRVNLHIAFSSTRMTIGTPIIFGGF